MNNNKYSSKIGLLVISCDNYSDLWIPFFEFFNESWPDCPYKVHLLSNKLDFKSNYNVEVIKVGDDKSWSDNVITALNQMQEFDYVFLLLEDMLLNRKVDNKKKMLFFYSDSRSKKVLNIKQNNNVTVHLYEPRFKLQVQLYGYANIEYKTEKTKSIWSSLNSFSKKNYLSELSPGEKINSLDDLKYNVDNEEAFYNFSLIYFKVSKLECLQLSEIKNIRVEFVYTESSDKKYYMVP